MLGSCYGSRVAVLVGPGLNGADGRVAAAWLRSRGAKVDVIDVAAQPKDAAGLRPGHRRGLRSRLLASLRRAAVAVEHLGARASTCPPASTPTAARCSARR